MYLVALGIRSSYHLQVRTFKARLGSEIGYSDVNTHQGYSEVIALVIIDRHRRSYLIFRATSLNITWPSMRAHISL